MASGSWSYEPLDPRRFPVGRGPFRVSGMAFVTALRYVERRLPGGRRALRKALAKDPFLSYYEQEFDPAQDYDASALVRLLGKVAELTHSPVGRFIESRSRWSATREGRGPLKPAVGTSPETMAERLYRDFNRYFSPTRARTVSISKGRFEGELSLVPAPMNGLHVGATNGFVAGALELAGARRPRFEWEAPESEGEHQGVPVQRLRFVATWGGDS